MTLLQLAALFEERKDWIVGGSGLSKDALHIYFGLTLFLLVRLAWRGRGGWLVAWAAVLAMACGGEFLDSTREAATIGLQPDAAHWHDIWNTIFWPTILLLIGRWLQPANQASAVRGSGEHAQSSLEQS